MRYDAAGKTCSVINAAVKCYVMDTARVCVPKRSRAFSLIFCNGKYRDCLLTGDIFSTFVYFGEE